MKKKKLNKIGLETITELSEVGALQIKTGMGFWRRFWNLVSNPFFYLFKGVWRL